MYVWQRIGCSFGVSQGLMRCWVFLKGNEFIYRESETSAHNWGAGAYLFAD